MAVTLFCLSLTPSLLPRDWLLQGIVSGVLTVIGYGIGALVGLAVRRLFPRSIPAIKRVAWWALAIWGLVVVAAFLYLGSGWQRDIRLLVGASQPTRYRYVLILLVSLLLLAAAVEGARLLRRLTRWIDRGLDRWLPEGVAAVLGAMLVGLLLIGFLHGVVYDSLIAVANRAFKTINAETIPGDAPPGTLSRSGGTGSLVSWASLGNKGRDFIASGPVEPQLRAFGGDPVHEPIRAYVGLESTPTVEEEAALAVRELERMGAFARAVVCVVTATGTGHIDRDAVDALEYMYNGNSAIVSIQYSYLPSWISFLVDRTKAKQAGRELFNAVYARWSRMPRDARPALLVFGESLGAFGAEAAFSGADDLRNRTDGALFEGPPNDSYLWNEFVRKRDAGSGEINPVYAGGSTVRFGDTPSDLDHPTDIWPFPRVAYLQHASDPVVWWSWRLMLHEPDWLKERRGTDVLPSMRWYPFVTFWQVSADMALSIEAPPGHGHNYANDAVGAWARVAPPEGWTPEKTARLTAVLESARQPVTRK